MDFTCPVKDLEKAAIEVNSGLCVVIPKSVIIPKFGRYTKKVGHYTKRLSASLYQSDCVVIPKGLPKYSNPL